MRKKRIGKFLYLAPRVLSILFIIFLSFFSLDIFGNNYTFWEILTGLFMHNIPSLVLLAILLISWKHELVGGIVFILAGLLYSFLTLITASMDGFQWYYFSWNLIISGPAFLIGILFFINWFKKNC